MKAHIVKCPICSEIRKTWGQDSFQHCEVRHPIKENLYIKSSSPKVSDEGIEPKPQKVPALEPGSDKPISEPPLKQETDTSTEETAPVSNTLKSEGKQEPKTEENSLTDVGGGNSPTSSDLNLETEPETKKDEEVNPDDYKYQCSNCNELFNELTDGRCPDCGALLENE